MNTSIQELKNSKVSILKISIIYSLIYLLLTNFVFNIYHSIFPILINEIDISDPFNFFIYYYLIPIYQAFIFTYLLIKAHKKYIDSHKINYKGVLLITLLLILFHNFFLSIFQLIYNYVEIFFYKDFNFIKHYWEHNGFSSFRFQPINDLVYMPFIRIKNEIIHQDFIGAFFGILYFPVLLSIFIINYENDYYLFKKYNIPEKKALIPIVNKINLLQLTKNPSWWIILIYIPFVRFFIKYYIYSKIAKDFNKSNNYAVGMIILPWYFIGAISLNKNEILIKK